MKSRSLAMLALALSASTAFAQDRADIDRTQVIGNRELPKVLYIVPWKKPPPGELSGKPPSSVLDDLMAPIDRDVYRRHMSYDQQLSSAKPAGAR
ncbi:MAG: hypothetical protein V4792_19575 [Pseudomonadota bacterium]